MSVPTTYGDHVLQDLEERRRGAHGFLTNAGLGKNSYEERGNDKASALHALGLQGAEPGQGGRVAGEVASSLTPSGRRVEKSPEGTPHVRDQRRGTGGGTEMMIPTRLGFFDEDVNRNESTVKVGPDAPTNTISQHASLRDNERDSRDFTPSDRGDTTFSDRDDTPMPDAPRARASGKKGANEAARSVLNTMILKGVEILKCTGGDLTGYVGLEISEDVCSFLRHCATANNEDAKFLCMNAWEKFGHEYLGAGIG